MRDEEVERRLVHLHGDEVALVRAREERRELARGSELAARSSTVTPSRGLGLGLRAYCLMNCSTASYASSSAICFGGDFIRYALGPSSAPPTPLFSASFASRTASMTIPAEFGESQTSSLSSTLSGTSPKDEPSIRMYAHLRSVSQGT